MATLDGIGEWLRAEFADCCESFGVPGYVGGVYHEGEQVVVAHGCANLAVGAPMTEDTGFLVGSITKVFTTTLLLRYVARGMIDLDDRVAAHLADFTLSPPWQAEQIQVRNLLNHTNGIDADMVVPDLRGPEALSRYLEVLARCGTLFQPDEYVTYSNPGFAVAGRLLEVISGKRFHELLERELFQAIGMADSSTSADQAILRRTAVGHFWNHQEHALRRTELFMLPPSISAAGSTPIVTIEDLLAFGRTHLAGGIAPSGKRVVPAELAERMTVVTHDMGTPNVPPVGLGWWIVPFGETIVLCHGGNSPGGASHLMIAPEQRLVFAGFGNGPGASVLHDRLMLGLLRQHLGLEVPELVSAPPLAKLEPYVGSFVSHQMRGVVTATDDELLVTWHFEPMDADHARIIGAFSGGTIPPPPQRFVPVGDRLFAPVGQALASFSGFYGRQSLLTFHGESSGRPAYASVGLRLARRELEHKATSAPR